MAIGKYVLAGVLIQRRNVQGELHLPGFKLLMMLTSRHAITTHPHSSTVQSACLNEAQREHWAARLMRCGGSAFECWSYGCSLRWPRGCCAR